MDYTKHLQAAALSRAAAIRALHSYRAARDRAEDRGADTTLLIEPPAFEKLDDEYVRLTEEVVDQRIDSPNVARSAIDLLAAILSDQQLGEILDEGGPASIEKDRADGLRLLARLSTWVNKLDIDDAIREEQATAGMAPRPRTDRTFNIVDRIKAEIRRRVAVISPSSAPSQTPTTAASWRPRCALMDCVRRTESFTRSFRGTSLSRTKSSRRR